MGVIVAGGAGERMRLSGSTVPKPLTPLLGQPLVVHVAGLLRAHGCSDVLVLLGHHAGAIAEALQGLRRQQPELNLRWRDTGARCGNAGRLLKVRKELVDGPFVMTWCDIFTDLDLSAMRAFHARQGGLATVAAVRPRPRFGRLEIEGQRVIGFREKCQQDEVWVNGGIFVLEPAVLECIRDENEAWEHGPMQRLIAASQLSAYRHPGHWHAIDSLADCAVIDALADRGQLPGGRE
jgi:glucose-1-phosphate cytidylyltransferase